MSLFTSKELARYSLTKALGELSNSHHPGIDGTVSGLEREVSDTLKKDLNTMGFLIPLQCLKSLNVTTATAGGFTVGTYLAQIQPALRSKSVVVAMGAQVSQLRVNLGRSYGLRLCRSTPVGNF
jgi:hypothetical protein